MSQITQVPDSLVFSCEGRLYDASTLVRMETHDPMAPAVYLTADGRKAFLLRVNDFGTMRVAPLGKSQLMAICLKHQMAFPNMSMDEN